MKVFRNSFAVLLVLTVTAYAGDIELNTALIQKFEKLKNQLAPADSTRTSITLRLGDLYSERARQKSYQEMEAQCAKCDSGKSDRQAALQNYQSVLNKIEPEQQTRVLAQMGHLYQLNGDAAKAQSLYEKVINSNLPDGLKEEALVSLAELHFKKRNFAAAKSYYAKVLALGESKKRSHVAYKIAWCYFYEGQIQQAVNQLEKILDTPELLQRFDSGSGVMAQDKQFQREVSKDLAGFLAYQNSGLDAAKELVKRSTEDSLSTNLSYMASELERLGHTQNAIAVWEFFSNNEKDAEKRFNAQLHLTKLYRDKAQKDKALDSFKNLLSLWSTAKVCANEEHCDSQRLEIRQLVIDWNRAEKLQLSEQLLTAYQEYINSFPQDMDMLIWSAQAHKAAGKYEVAFNDYSKAAELKASGATTKDPNVSKLNLEKMLLFVIEVAELSKNEPLIQQAQNNYLAKSTDKTMANDVRYQQIYAKYKAGDYASSSEDLYRLAVDPQTKNADIKMKAAELSLDALAQLKNNQLIADRAAEYAKVFPKSAPRFNSISQKAILNISAQAGMTDAQAFAAISKVDAKSLSGEDKVSYYKNKLILAERMKLWTEAKETAETLAALKEASTEDKLFAIERRIWFAELQLDFATAFEWMQKLPVIKKDDLQLALFADLAKKDANIYYEAYLNKNPKSDQAEAIALNIIKKSAAKDKALLKYKAILMKNPANYANLHLEQFAINSSPISAKELQQKSIEETEAAKTYWRIGFVNTHQDNAKKLSEHNLDTKTQATLQKSIKRRAQLLDAEESLLKSAVSRSDWMAQYLGLSVLSHEYKRFYEDILSLPMPDGLTPEEQNQYLQLLSQSATPYQIKSTELKAKYDEFSAAASSVISSYSDLLAKDLGPARKLVENEVNTLAKTFDGKNKEQLLATLNQKPAPKQSVDIKKLEVAKQEVRQDPFNINKLKELMNLEKSSGDSAMTSYLEARFERIPANGGGKL